MYKAIVVDDEPYMLEAWETLIDWQAFGYQLCGTARDGEEALALIKENNPDLVMTDIQMPVLDGLGLVRVMKEELGLETKTVIVSGYSEFAYAQQALHYQVNHYVLKPIMMKEIHGILTELKDELEKDRSAKEAATKVKAAADAAAILRLAKCGGAVAAEAAKKLLDIPADSRVVLLLAEAVSRDNVNGNSRSDGGTPFISAQLRAYVDEAIDDGSVQIWEFEEGPGRAGLLLVDNRQEEDEWENRLVRAAAVQPELLEHIAVYCSGDVHGLSELHHVYRQMLEVRQGTQLCLKAGLHLCRRQVQEVCRIEDMTCMVHELLHQIESGDQDGIHAAVHDLFEVIPLKYGWMQWTLEYLCGELLRRYEDQQNGSGWLLEWCKTAAEPENWTADRLRSRCMEISERLVRRKEPLRAIEGIIADSIVYLKSHYQEKVKILDIARQFHLNPVYFGQQFKRVTGSSFHDFIHHLRIEEAQKLIKRTDMRLSDIAAALGYHSNEYFTVKFKALTGKLPSAYKNACQR
ncbi:two-component system, response regulator YesN [Paenibacillus catalpae]|uniref:Two-component system, response regulator YesN n=1 Tax=Paenibacillus catalpae TaxID=1045775 RepID=A0A1I2FSF4_9BACL|nr:response regulator [Paenibacillus catalpae]SFF07923.1 two-component system, response regulator YesN [Paenibacillus catalpae]